MRKVDEVEQAWIDAINENALPCDRVTSVTFVTFADGPDDMTNEERIQAEKNRKKFAKFQADWDAEQSK